MAGIENTEIEQYLAGLGMGKSLVDRSLAVVTDVKKLLPQELERVFVTEYKDDEGNRHYENLWLFTQSYISESHGFLTGDNFDIVPVRPRLVRIDVEREHFDFETATEQSRLTVEISFPPSKSSGLSGTLRASGDNCTALVEVLRKTLIPLL